MLEIEPRVSNMLNKGSATELHPWSGLLPEDMLMSEGCAELVPIAWAL